MSLERLIEQRRIKNGTVESSLQAARERMEETNRRLGKEWNELKVTETLLNKVISL